MLDATLKMEMWAQNANPTVSIEANGDAGMILALMETGVERCIQKVADGVSGDAAFQARMIDSTIKLLNKHKQRILRRAKAPEDAQKKPTERMTPEEFMAFYNAWMSQATAEERDRFIKLSLETIAERIVKPL